MLSKEWGYTKCVTHGSNCSNVLIFFEAAGLMTYFAEMTLYTLTPNPALDVSGWVDRLVPNEKNYVKNERRDPGGNGINAARVACRLGVSATALGFIGGSTGDEIEALLKHEGVPTKFFRIKEHTRINITVTNEETHQQTRLTFQGPRVTAKEIHALLNQICSLKSPAILVLGGSLPAGCPKNFHARVAKVAATKKIGLIVDVPARNLSAVINASHFKGLLLKPNQVELEQWCGRLLHSDREIAKAAMRLAQKSALVCVSLAERGAILATRNHAWFATAPAIKARGTVGAGDSMVGAMASQLVHHGITRPEQIEALSSRSKRKNASIPEPLRDLLTWGLAAGAATAESVGTTLAKPSEIRRLCKKVKIRSLAFYSIN